MKLIIAGSRNLQISIEDILEELNKHSLVGNITKIVSGAASGIDECGEIYADHSGLPVKLFKADWSLHGRAAGPIRNREMAHYADALLLIWDGESKGSLSMKTEMEKLGKPVFQKIIKKE